MPIRTSRSCSSAKSCSQRGNFINASARSVQPETYRLCKCTLQDSRTCSRSIRRRCKTLILQFADMHKASTAFDRQSVEMRSCMHKAANKRPFPPFPSRFCTSWCQPCPRMCLSLTSIMFQYVTRLSEVRFWSSVVNMQ